MTIKPVSDLYLITYEDGRPYKYTLEAGEAIDAIGAGFKVEEFVSLENHRATLLQAGNHTEQHLDMVNSPVIPDCSCRTCRPVTFTDSRFVVCHECGNKRCPHVNDHRNACTGSNEPGQEGSAYPAEPQQEVKSALEHGMQRYAGAMQKLSEGDK